MERIQKFKKLLLKASTFVLSAANNSKLQSGGTVKLTPYPDVTENRSLRNTFTLPFHFSKKNFSILGTLFLEKYFDSMKFSSHKLQTKHNHELKSLKFYYSSIKSPPYNSRLFPVIGAKSLYCQPFERRNLTLTAYECKNKYANGTILYASDSSFIPLRKNMFFSIMDIYNLEKPDQSFIQKLIQIPLNHPLTPVKGLFGYAQQEV